MVSGVWFPRLLAKSEFRELKYVTEDFATPQHIAVEPLPCDIHCDVLRACLHVCLRIAVSRGSSVS